MKQLKQRLSSPTPPFFKKLRTIGLILAAISTVVLTAPITLPAGVLTAAGYAAVAGGVLSAVSQVTTSADDFTKVGDDHYAQQP